MLVPMVMPSRHQEAFTVVFRRSLESPYHLTSIVAHSQGPHVALVSVLNAQGGGFPHLRSEKAQGVGGKNGRGCTGDRSPSSKCSPKKKGPKEIPWLVLTAAFWLLCL